MPTGNINGVALYWELHGTAGELLVLVHGSWVDHESWSSVVPALSRSFRVLTYDRRGHSRSERPAGRGSILEDVADLAALVEHHGPGSAHVIGNSFGGSIALRLAIARPELFSSLIVHEPPIFGLLADERSADPALAVVRDRIAAVAQLLRAGDAAAGARAFVETIAFGPGAWDELDRVLRETFVFNAPTWLDELEDPEVMALDVDRLHGFPAPTLLTIGAGSPAFFPLVVERIARALPHAERATYAGAAHVPHLSHPQEYVDTVTAFIERSHPAPGSFA